MYFVKKRMVVDKSAYLRITTRSKAEEVALAVVYPVIALSLFLSRSLSLSLYINIYVSLLQQQSSLQRWRHLE